MLYTSNCSQYSSKMTKFFKEFEGNASESQLSWSSKFTELQFRTNHTPHLWSAEQHLKENCNVNVTLVQWCDSTQRRSNMGNGATQDLEFPKRMDKSDLWSIFRIPIISLSNGSTLSHQQKRSFNWLDALCMPQALTWTWDTSTSTWLSRPVTSSQL